MKLFPVINNIDNGFINSFGKTEVFYCHKSLHENKWTATEERGIKEKPWAASIPNFSLAPYPAPLSNSFH